MNTFLLLQAIRNRLMPELENLPLLTKRMGEKGLHVISVPLDEQLRLVSAAKQEV